MRKFALLLLSACLFFACDEKGQENAVKVTLSTEELTVTEGKSAFVPTVVEPKDAKVTLAFESSDPTIAEVNAAGLVYGNKVGNCEITILKDGEPIEQKLKVNVVGWMDEVKNMEFRKLKLWGLDIVENYQRVKDEETGEEKYPEVETVGGTIFVADSLAILTYFMFDYDLMYVDGTGYVAGEGGLVPCLYLPQIYAYKDGDKTARSFILSYQGVMFFSETPEGNDTIWREVPNKNGLRIPRIGWMAVGEDNYDHDAVIDYWTGVYSEEDPQVPKAYPDFVSLPRMFVPFIDPADGSEVMGSVPFYGYFSAKDLGFMQMDGNSVMEQDLLAYNFTVNLPKGLPTYGGVKTESVVDEATGEVRTNIAVDENGKCVIEYETINYVKGEFPMANAAAKNYKAVADNGVRKGIDVVRSCNRAIVLQSEGLKSLVRK